MEQELKDQGKFKDFYQFTFNFAKNPGQKGLGKNLLFLYLYKIIAMACNMLQFAICFAVTNNSMNT